MLARPQIARLGSAAAVLATSGLLGLAAGLPIRPVVEAVGRQAPLPTTCTGDFACTGRFLFTQPLVVGALLGAGALFGLVAQRLTRRGSSVAAAAWMLDHDSQSLDLIIRVFDGASEGLTRDDILDNVTLYWLTNTAVSSARLYWESKLAFFAPKGVPIPTAVSVFPNEIYAAPRSWTEKAYPKLIHYNRLPKGTHFAAWEQPQFFSEEVRAGFRSLR